MLFPRLWSFWCGVFLLLFVAWAWRDSMLYETTAGWDRQHWILLRHAEAGLNVYETDGAESGFSHFRTEFDVEQRPMKWWPKASLSFERTEDGQIFQTFLPHWLVLAVMLVLWLPVVLWRRVKLKKKRFAWAPA